MHTRWGSWQNFIWNSYSKFDFCSLSSIFLSSCNLLPYTLTSANTRENGLYSAQPRLYKHFRSSSLSCLAAEGADLSLLPYKWTVDVPPTLAEPAEVQIKDWSSTSWITLWLTGALTMKRLVGGIQTNEKNATALAPAFYPLYSQKSSMIQIIPYFLSMSFLLQCSLSCLMLPKANCLLLLPPPIVQ